MESFDLSPFFGEGLLAVTRRLQDAKQPFVGQVELAHGNIAQDLAHYYLSSEQIPTAFNLSIKFDREGNVTGAGGMFLQAMPHAEERTTEELEKRIADLPSMGIVFGEGVDPESFVLERFSDLGPRFLSNRRIEFFCRCNRERLRTLLTMLPTDELEDIRKNGPFPLEARCHYCNTVYLFDRPAIERIVDTRSPRS